MKLLFARTPRRYWQYVNLDDNFWMPLSYPCLASVIRERMPELEIKMIDCCALEIGWKTFEQRMMEEKPDFFGTGDETLYADEGVRAAWLAKKANPDCVTIGGGRHYPFLPELYLGPDKPFDYLVFGEGEITCAELIEELSKENPKPENVAGILYHDGEKVVRTPFRPVVEDLDSLPMPAYDMMHPEYYGQKGRLWAFRNSIPVQHSRGCVSSCTFCSFWPAESPWKMVEGKPTPYSCYRTKSAGLMVDQMEKLYTDYGARQFNWVDGTWNVTPKWNEAWADEVIRRKMKFGWFAFMRADFILRDEKLGIFEKLVKAGLNFVLIGAERADPEDLEGLKKKNYGDDAAMRAMRLIRKKYPQVWVQCTYIMGFPEETRESMLGLLEHAIKSKTCFPGYHFITPMPGTQLWEEAHEKGWIVDDDFRNYDWFNPIIRCNNMSREEMMQLFHNMTRDFILKSPQYYYGIFSPHSIKRNLYGWFWLVGFKFLMARIKARFSESSEGYLSSTKPGWYDT